VGMVGGRWLGVAPAGWAELLVYNIIVFNKKITVTNCTT